MSRKKQEDKPMKTDGWMNTFADLMNLLLCFFVMLFAMSDINAEKFQQIVASFSSSFSILDGGSEGLEDGMLIASGASQLNELSEYYSSMGENKDGDEETELENAMGVLDKAELEESEEMGEDINDMIDEAGRNDAIEVQVTQHYVCLNMKGALLFASASADLTDEAKSLLDDVAVILKKYEDHLIEIEGHTDNIPINHEIFTSNNVLSDYRALAVFEHLVDEGINPVNLKHSGRGEYAPIATNDTAEGRAQNRRVEIKIYNSFSSK